MARISSGTMTVVVFAMLIGLGGAYIVRQQMGRQTLPELPPTGTVANIIVPVAGMDLEAGQTVTESDIAMVPYTPAQFEKSPHAKLPYMRNSNQIKGRTVKVPMKKGEAFLNDQLYALGSGPGIADKLQAGYRAVTVPIENVGAVQGFARPGSMVDVLFRSNPEGQRPEVTLTLLERIEVLAINALTQANRQVDLKDEGTVTLAVTPQQAKVLKVCEGRGELSLTLRNNDDALDTVPFDIGQLDPTLGALGMLGEFPLASNSREKVGAADKAGADSVDTILTSSNERVTLDDLLGIRAQAQKRKIEMFLGASKTIVEFEEASDDAYRLLQRGSRIRTPIAHDDRQTPTLPASRQQVRAGATPGNFASIGDR